MIIATIQRFLIGLLFISIPNLVFTQSKVDNPGSGKPKIYLVGAVHSMHFKPAHHYTINDLLAQVTKLKPDVVCGEITPQAFKHDMEGYYPLEASFLAEMAGRNHYRFIPVDWRIDASTQELAGSIFPKDIEKMQSGIDAKYIDGINKYEGESLYDFIHAPENVSLMDSMFEKVVASNPISEIAMGSWQERNRRIVENSLPYLKNSNVVVFVFGAAHLPQIQRQLEKLGYTAEIPERLFTPSNDTNISPQVISRWKDNLAKLIKIRDGISGSYDDRKKVSQSKRIDELKDALKIAK